MVHFSEDISGLLKTGMAARIAGCRAPVQMRRLVGVTGDGPRRTRLSWHLPGSGCGAVGNRAAVAQPEKMLGVEAIEQMEGHLLFSHVEQLLDQQRPRALAREFSPDDCCARTEGI